MSSYDFMKALFNGFSSYYCHLFMGSYLFVEGLLYVFLFFFTRGQQTGRTSLKTKIKTDGIPLTTIKTGYEASSLVSFKALFKALLRANSVLK